MNTRWILLLSLLSLILGGCGQTPAAEQTPEPVPLNATDNASMPTPSPAPQSQGDTQPPPSSLSTPTRSFVVVPTQPQISQEIPVMNEVPIPTPFSPSLEKIVAQAKDDLAKRLAIDPAQIEVLEAASVTWPDGSLGCPKPDMVYPQVQVDGLRLRFRAMDGVYEYHSGGSRAPFLCE